MEPKALVTMPEAMVRVLNFGTSLGLGLGLGLGEVDLGLGLDNIGRRNLL